jgi:uncharacterized protein YndB with AHSA1/START domain
MACGRPIELRVDSRVELHFHHADLSPQQEPTPERHKKYAEGYKNYGRITKCEPPRLLSYTWGEQYGETSEVTFELTPQGENVILVLTHRRLDDHESMVSVASGWHTHLGILIDRLHGHDPQPYWTVHDQLEAEYEQRLSQG